jgi:pimeloyl-ACP methyl ester carboxylesterase
VIGSVIEIARNAGASAGATEAKSSLSAFFVPSWLKTSIVALTFTSLWSRMNLKATLATVAPALSCTANYLSAGRRRSEILGELTRLIDHLDEQTDTRYRHVHLLGYSFGSIVAIDALFPRELAVGRKMKRVDTLVTIGCPFDFVRTYWPKYFQARQAAADVPRRWLNVYCELDVLGSNFLDEDATTQATERGIEIQNQGQRRPREQDNLAFGPSAEEDRSLWEYAGFIGFRTHSVYWDRDSENALSCFEPIVQTLYAEELAR